MLRLAPFVPASGNQKLLQTPYQTFDHVSHAFPCAEKVRKARAQISTFIVEKGKKEGVGSGCWISQQMTFATDESGRDGMIKPPIPLLFTLKLKPKSCPRSHRCSIKEVEWDHLTLDTELSLLHIHVSQRYLNFLLPLYFWYKWSGAHSSYLEVD